MTEGEAARPAEDADGETSAEDALVKNSKTLSGANGKFLEEELAKILQAQDKVQVSSCTSDTSPQNAWESLESGVAAVYDGPLAWFFNFAYDVLHLSSGRDKLCAFIQGYAKFASAALCKPGGERHFMYRGIEDSLSDGRKIFRLFKEFREVYKVRRGLNRLMEGISGGGVLCIPAACGALDTVGHTASFLYYLFDNLLWAASVGLVRSKEVPKWQRQMWDGFRRNGPVISYFGGVAKVKRRKNLASIWRLFFGFIANVLLLRRAVDSCAATKDGEFQGPDDPRLFHSLELIGMAANFRILWSKLGYTRLSHEWLGLLAMLASACGIWTNWRKVVRKKCGTKNFVTTVERRVSAASSGARYGA